MTGKGRNPIKTNIYIARGYHRTTHLKLIKVKQLYIEDMSTNILYGFNFCTLREGRSGFLSHA